MAGPGKGAWWEFWLRGAGNKQEAGSSVWQESIRGGRTPHPMGEVSMNPLLAHYSLSTAATPEASWALLPASSGVSFGVPQLSLMEKQGKASVCVLELSYQNKRSWGKANTVEAQAKMEKTAFYGRSY